MALKKTKRVKHHKHKVKPHKSKRNKHLSTHKKSKRNKHFSLHKKSNKHRRRKSNRVQKGGFGPGSRPLIGSPWNATKGGDYYSYNGPIGVGGTNPYFGNLSPSPQRTPGSLGGASFVQSGGSAVHPLIPQPLLDGYRSVLGFTQDLYNRYNGFRPPPSMSPAVQDFQQP